MRRWQRNGWMDLSECQDIDSVDTEGTYTLVIGRWDGLSGMDARRAPLNMQWLVLRIGDADFHHCWFVDYL